MILLDTNVVSAMMRIQLEPRVAAWLSRQPANALATSAVTVFEIQNGIEQMPIGKRRNAQKAALTELLNDLFSSAVLPFDTAAAVEAGRIRAQQLGSGNNVAVPDSLIAGIARSVGAAIATRNTKDFAGLGIALVDPWAP
jgi:toxin FitB